MIDVRVSWIQIDTAPEAASTVYGGGGGGVFRDPVLTTLFDNAPSHDELHEQQIQHEDEALMLVIAQFMINGAFA